VYESDWLVRLRQLPADAGVAARWRIPANVWGLGLTSLLTDISSEMVVSILPAYLLVTMGLAPMALGLASGLHEGAPLLATWIGGLTADRLGRRKLTATFGYVLSLICRAGWLAFPVRSLGVLGTLIVGDRLGKAVRTAPRDALISLSARPGQLATAFGIHRAFDAAGAAIGPVLAFALLWGFPYRYDLLFFTSFLIAALGVLALVLFVDERALAPHAAPPEAAPPDAAPPEATRPAWTDVWQMLQMPGLRRIAIVAAAFGLATISDAFLYVLVVRNAHAGEHWIALLYTATALVFLTLAVPGGMIADRVGHRGLFVLGHVPLLFAYGVVLSGWQAWPWSPLVVVVLLGAYYASCDGVLVALAGAVIPARSRSTGLAAVATMAAGARLSSALLFGVLWSQAGDRVAVGTFAIALLVVLAVAAPAMRSTS
jgi:MFS family permease